MSIGNYICRHFNIPSRKIQVELNKIKIKILSVMYVAKEPSSGYSIPACLGVYQFIDKKINITVMLVVCFSHLFFICVMSNHQ